MSSFTDNELISPLELQRALRTNAPLVLLDIRFTPGTSDSAQRYHEGHIPGAYYLDLPTQLADATLTGRGSNPLPAPDQLQADLRALGINDNSTVIVYDDTNGGPASRAWWVLKWAGLDHVQVLDGGLAAWRRASLPEQLDPSEKPLRGNVTVRPGQLESVDARTVQALRPDEVWLVDARPPSGFGGDGENGGHIPGAINIPAGTLLDGNGQFLFPEEARRRFEQSGIDTRRPLVAYCGGGVASALVVLQARRAGIDARLYPGSWSEWRADPQRPVEA